MSSEKIIINGKSFHSDNLHQMLEKCQPGETWAAAVVDFLSNWFDESDEIITRTSGSTGIPKEIKLKKEAMRNSARMTNSFFGLEESKSALLCLPASYIAGKMMLVRALVGGFNLLVVEPSANPFENVQLAIDFTAITPYQLYHSVETLTTKQIKNVIVGGGQLSSRLENLVQHSEIAFYETYGMTETCSHIALRRVNGVDKSDVFTVLKGVGIAIDSRNCLIINAPHLHEELIQTNDLVAINGTSSFKWLGRFDSIINSGGVKVHPEQVEKQLEELIPQRFFIAGVPDEVLENKVVLVIESESYSLSDQQQLRTSMEQLLKRYEIPKEIYFVNAFVSSEGNKILRKETLKNLFGTQNDVQH